MLRRPAFWMAFLAINVAAWWFTVVSFDQAFPVVTLELTMNRGGALAAARELALHHGWGPEEFEQAAAFELDEAVQVFVELEAGGKEAFREMLTAGLYSPYVWRVRHFRPGEATETEVRFTPAGRLYGFLVTLPEQEPGPSLDPAAARRIAEEAAASGWQIRFEDFELVESSQELRPGGRTDHTFVYERPAVGVGEGRYRLHLVVSGDRFTELSHVVKLPEGFHRRFAELRAGNRALSSAARIVMLVLLLGGGCLGGLFFLLRRRALLWKPALTWGLGIGLLQVAAGLNRSSLWWMEYDTAVHEGNFVIENLFSLFSGFVWLGLGTTFVFLAAEGLTRHALPGQIQLWRSGSAAATPSLLGRTGGAYLLLGVYCAYKVAFSLFTSQNLGWWSPSSYLSDPNVLATWLPWLEPIAAALRAGFAEECLFRAIPLASAVLLGRRFGRPWLWLGTALILQAVVFGAAHANYPNEPAYARLVELILPSVLYGLMYLRFGLLPCILLHFAFDVLAYGLPVITSTAPGAAFQVTLMVGIALLPLWVVLVARWRRGGGREVDESDWNGSWTPPEPPAADRISEASPRELRRGTLRWLGAAGLAGLALWLATSTFRADAPPLEVDREQAVAAAREALRLRGWEPDDEMTALATVRGELDERHRFVWERGGQELYRHLLGGDLRPPHWHVRYVRFTGDLAARVEEYQAWISPRGKALQTWHRLPEDRAGASLSEEEAKSLAAAELAETFGLSPDSLVEISAVPTQQTARRDWRLVFRDPAASSAEGETRIFVVIAGDEVVSSVRRIEPPEPWRRAERDRTTLTGVLHDLAFLLPVPILLGGTVAAVVRWSDRRLAGRAAGVSFVLLALLGSAVLVNLWPAQQAELSTAQAPASQALGRLGGVLPPGVGFLVAFALGVGFSLRWPPLRAPARLRATVLPGLALGFAVAGATAVVSFLRPAWAPEWPDYSAAAGWLPWLGATLHPLARFFVEALLAMLIFTGVDRLSAGWTRHRVASALLLIVLGVVVRGWSVPTVPIWLTEGVWLGVLGLAAYALVLRRQLSLIPTAVAAVAACRALREGFLTAFPAALPGAAAAAVLIFLSALWWTSRLRGEPYS